MKYAVVKETFFRNCDPLKKLPHDYWDTGDFSGLMEKISPWMIEFCKKRLHPDPDIVGDFYLYFFERTKICLERYKTRQHLPFTGYLATYLRHEYYNFIKPRRHQKLLEYKSEEIFGNSAFPDILSDTENRERLELELEGRIQLLSLSLRLPLKLQYGLQLNCEELRYLTGKSETPGFAAAFLIEFNHRKVKTQKALQKLYNRAAFLNYMINASPDRNDLRSNPIQWRRWKKRIEYAIEGRRIIYKQYEISHLLGINKSTVSRRIKRAIEEVKGCESQAQKGS